jgi:hypothetical protein
MRPFTTLLASLLITLSFVHAEEPTGQPEPASSEQAVVRGPKIASDEPVFDFGLADNSQPIDHTFVIRNEGDTTLEISRVRPTCGCTVANITSKSLAPGETSEITTRLSLPGRTGRQTKILLVHSNDPDNPQYRLTLTGEMTTALQVEPVRHFIGQIQPGAKIRVETRVTSTTDEPFSITGIEASVPDMTAEVEAMEEGKSYRITTLAHAGDSPGLYQANLKILTDHPARKVIDIPINGQIVGDVLVAPQDITLSLQHETPVTRYIVLRPGTQPTFELVNVTTPDPDIKVNVFPFGENGYRIQLENITAQQDLDGKSVILTTSLPSSRELKVPFRIVN